MYIEHETPPLVTTLPADQLPVFAAQTTLARLDHCCGAPDHLSAPVGRNPGVYQKHSDVSATQKGTLLSQMFLGAKE